MGDPGLDRLGRYLALAAMLALALGCDALPRDNAGTLERVRGGVLHVGVADHPPWVTFEGNQVAGIEPTLLTDWARRLNAEIQWHQGAEVELVEALHRRELDVVAAGLDAKTPYSSKLGLTQPYVEFTDPRGTKRQKVLAVVQGESAFLLALDRFLAEQDQEALRQTVQRMVNRRSQERQSIRAPARRPQSVP